MQTIYIETTLEKQEYCKSFLNSIQTRHPELCLKYEYEQEYDLSIHFTIIINDTDGQITNQIIKKMYVLN